MATGSISTNASTDTAADTVQITDVLSANCRRLKLTEVGIAASRFALVATGLLLLAFVIDHWAYLIHTSASLGSFGRWMFFLALVIAFPIVLTKQTVQHVRRRFNPLFAAQQIEIDSPEIKNSISNFWQLRTPSTHVHPSIQQAMAARANLDLTDDRIQDGIDHRSLSQWGYAGLAVLALTTIYFAWMPQPSMQTIHRILIPWDSIARPSEITISNILPGDIEAQYGDAVQITAEVDGLDDDDPVRLFYRAANGSSTGQHILMTPRSGTSIFTATMADNELGIQQSMLYWIVAGEPTKRTAQSEIFQITAVAAPHIQIQSIQYAYPAYTQLPPTVVTDRFNIDAVEGTELTIKAESNQVIETASLYLFRPNVVEPTKRHASHIQKKSCEFQLTLKLLDDQLTPEFSHFEIVFSTAEGKTASEPIRYGIQVQADIAPEITIESPTADEFKDGPLQLPLNQNLKIQFQAHDPDYGLEQIDFVIQHGDQQPITKSLFHHALGSEDVIQKNVVFNPQALNIPVGSRVILFSNATDNRRISARPEPNVSSSEHLVIHIVEPDKSGNSSETTNNSGNGDSEQADNPDQPNPPDQNDPQSDDMPEDSDDNQGESTTGQDGTGGGEGSEGNASKGEVGGSGDGQQTDKPQNSNGDQNGPKPDAQGDMGKPSENPKTGDPSSDPSEDVGESKPNKGEPTEENMNDPTNGNTGDQGNPNEQQNQGDLDTGNDTEVGTGDSSSGTPTGEQGDQSNQNNNPTQETQGAKNEDLHDGEIFERTLKHMRENQVSQNNKQPMNPQTDDGANSDSTQIQRNPQESQSPTDAGDPNNNPNNQRPPTEQENNTPNGQETPMEGGQGETTDVDSNSTNPTETSENSASSQSNANNASTDPATGTGGSGTSAKTLGETDGPEESTDGSQQQDNTGQQTSNEFAEIDGSTGTGQESEIDGGPLNDPNNRLEQSKMDRTLTEQELANLQYTRKATDLALQYLKDKQHDPDQQLLDDLGITAEQMREMVARYEKLKKDNTPQGKQTLDESLRALGLRTSKNQTPRTVNVQSENVTGVRNMGVVSGLPTDLRQKFRSFRKGTNVSDE
ncbi:MAG: hypothetical protein HOB73_07195 [Planctomycetaceae bacterium]|jgi:hypothetical protein|nr:hypothetical protein [Planctomycetaceae bacterium]